MAGKFIHEGVLDGHKKSEKFWKLIEVEVEGFTVREVKESPGE